MSAYQQGVFNLVSGTSEYIISFPSIFSEVPALIDVQVYNTNPANLTPLWIEGVVTQRDIGEFTVTLTQAPDTNDYVMSWFAGDMQLAVSNPVLPGKALSNLPEHQGNLSDASMVFMLVPGRTPKAKLVRLTVLKNSLAAHHRFSATQIVDSSVSGRIVLTGTAAQARASINAPSTTDVADAITLASDATAFGKSILNSANALAARTFLDVPSVAEVTPAITLAGSVTAFGESLVSAATASDARSLLSAAAASHTHTPADLGAAEEEHTHVVTDLIAAGFMMGFLQSVTEATARNYLKVMPEHGWKDGYINVASNRVISTSDMGSKLVVTANCNIELAGTSINTDYSGRVGIYVSSGVTATISAGAGVTIVNPNNTTLLSGFSATPGYYTAERVGDSKWVLEGGIHSDVRNALYASSLSNFKQALGFVPNDLTTASFINWFLESTTPELARYYIGAGQSAKTVVTITPSSVELLSDHFSGNSANHLFVINGATSLEIDDIGMLLIGESFSVHAATHDVVITTAANIKLNDGIVDAYYENFVIKAGCTWEFFFHRSVGSDQWLVADIKYDPPSARMIWVSSQYGSNLTGQRGRQDFPFASLDQAAAAVTSSDDIIIVTPGTYNASGNLNVGGGTWYFHPGASVYSSSATSLFSTTITNPNLKVYGYGDFYVAGPLVTVSQASSNSVIEVNKLMSYGAGETTTFFSHTTASGSSAQLRVTVRQQVSRPAGKLMDTVFGTSVPITRIDLGKSSVNVDTLMAAQGPHTTTVEGGYITLATAVMTGDSGGVTRSVLWLQAPESLNSTNPGTPAYMTTHANNSTVKVTGCHKLNISVIPGPGYMVLDNCYLYGELDVDSDTLLLVNCSKLDGAFTAGSPYTTYVGGALTLSSSIAVPGTLTLSGGATALIDPSFASVM